MAHYRSQVRDAVAAAISGISASVEVSRTYPVELIPAVAVYIEAEEPADDEELPSMGRHRVVEVLVSLEIRTWLLAGQEGAADDILGEIQEALDSADVKTWAYWIRYGGVPEGPEIDTETEKPMQVMTVAYVVRTGYNANDTGVIVL